MKYIIILFLTLSISVFSQKDRQSLGKSYAEKELKMTLKNKSLHNVAKNDKLIIEDKATAIGVAEPILFNIYGKEKIIGEKPYEIYLIENHWIIQGTLPKGSKGGTFLIIIDGRNSEVLKITHGK